jgi:hypothetical protein
MSVVYSQYFKRHKRWIQALAMNLIRLYEQILQMNDLKLIIFDPLASFVHADVNSDPAAGAALDWFTGTESATETGASVDYVSPHD